MGGRDWEEGCSPRVTGPGDGGYVSRAIGEPETLMPAFWRPDRHFSPALGRSKLSRRRSAQMRV